MATRRRLRSLILLESELLHWWEGSIIVFYPNRSALDGDPGNPNLWHPDNADPRSPVADRQQLPANSPVRFRTKGSRRRRTTTTTISRIQRSKGGGNGRSGAMNEKKETQSIATVRRNSRCVIDRNGIIDVRFLRRQQYERRSLRRAQKAQGRVAGTRGVLYRLDRFKRPTMSPAEGRWLFRAASCPRLRVPRKNIVYQHESAPATRGSRSSYPDALNACTQKDRLVTSRAYNRHFVQQGDICPSYGTDSTCIRSFSVARTLTGVGRVRDMADEDETRDVVEKQAPGGYGRRG
ncbi:hypothetical protein EAG_01162 [Camponotus floridanus]|uniref:Uncharacterized protein n=1 Tax=Camponotus floridanus TaxID=104421 RepID=E2B1E1_CAMFO|nr:hypothetical protein EAG_01162 [Camponotus floridanus]